MDDILVRLAELRKQPVYDTQTIRDAVADIERLRAELLRLQAVVGEEDFDIIEKLINPEEE